MGTEVKPMGVDVLMAIKERCERATEGPWKVETDSYTAEMDGSSFGLTPIIPGKGGQGDEVAVVTDDMYSEDVWRANAEFIAHARTDIPALIAEVERLLGRVYEKEVQ